MTVPSQFAEIVASDKALTQSEDGEAMLAAYPSMRHRSALIALVRDARSLLADMRPYTDVMICYASTVTEHPPNGWDARIDAFLIATEEP